MTRNIVAAAIPLTVVLLQPVVVGVAEIKVWTARAIATVLAEIGPEFERKTGHKLIISSDLHLPSCAASTPATRSIS